MACLPSSSKASSIIRSAAHYDRSIVLSLRSMSNFANSFLASSSPSCLSPNCMRPLLFSKASNLVSKSSCNISRPTRISYFSSSFSSLPPFSKLSMPALSPTMKQGNIAAWKKKEGDAIAPGDVIAEIETDKATVDLEAQDEVFLAKILYPEGSKDVKVGQPIAITVEDQDDVAAFRDYTETSADASVPSAPTTPPSSSTSKAPAQDQKQQQSAQDLSAFPPHDRMAMPALSPTMQQGTIAAWRKKPGDTIAPGDVIAQIETDKAMVDFEAQDDGVLAKILVPEGTKDVPVGSIIAIVVEEGQDISPFETYSLDGAGSSASAPSSFPTESPSASTTVPSAAPSTQKYDGPIGPAVLRLAMEFPQVNLDLVKGSGPHGRIVKGDILAALDSGMFENKATSAPTAQTEADIPSLATTKTTPLPTQKKATPTGAPATVPSPDGADYVDEPVSNIRQIIARRLLESKQKVPHAFATTQFTLDQIAGIRKRINDPDKDIAISVNDFVIKACAVALQRCPIINASWNEQTKSVTYQDSIDISMAVAIEGGLITPIIFNAAGRGIKDISSTSKSLAQKARDGKLKPEEFQGGTFSISNLGMFGITQFSAIINPPQSCILAVGGPCKTARINPITGTVESVTMGKATLSYDSRVVTEADAAAFLGHFSEIMSNPEEMIL